MSHGDLPRSREELADYLDGLGVPAGAYHLYGGHVDDAVVMDLRPEGWVTFHSERGVESSLRRHPDEPTACAAVVGRLRQEGRTP